MIAEINLNNIKNYYHIVEIFLFPFLFAILRKRKYLLEQRNTCYKCYRPKVSCMCKYFTQIDTKTKFVLLMHPKEYKKTKNGTGHFTNASLENCEIHIGIDFTHHKRINELLDNKSNDCYILYPGNDSLKLNEEKPDTAKNLVLFLIDSTWPCSKKIIRESKNLKNLQKMSFTHTKSSEFIFKEQPAIYCLSTMESTLCILELLNKHNIETIPEKKLNTFLDPFHQMVDYQINCSKELQIRYKRPNKV